MFSLSLSFYPTNVLHTLCRYWLSVGAQPSDPVQRLLFRAGLLPPTPMMAMARKAGPRDTRPVDPLSGRILTPEKPANADQAKDAENAEEKEAESAEVNDG